MCASADPNFIREHDIQYIVGMANEWDVVDLHKVGSIEYKPSHYFKIGDLSDGVDVGVKDVLRMAATMM